MPDGQTYLVTIWRTGATWSGAALDGEYAWQLEGCPTD
jgi:hypothetical protein